MEPGVVYELVPLILTAVLVGVFLLFLAGYVLSRLKPPTGEPVIGNFRFTLKGTGLSVEGVTTTARSVVDTAALRQVKNLSKSDAGVIDLFRRLHLYAVRDGRSRVLVVSDVNVEGADYSDATRGARFVFPYGWVSYRNVYGYGVMVSADDYPDFFTYFRGDWDRGVFLFPENLRTGVHDTGLLEKAVDLTKALMLMKEAARQSERVKALEGVVDVQDKHIEEAYSKVSEEVDRRLLAEQRARLTSPFPSEEPVEAAGGFLPRMTKGRIATLLAGAALGYWYLPQHSTLMPNSAAIVGGAAAWLFWLVWDNWLKEM